MLIQAELFLCFQRSKKLNQAMCFNSKAGFPDSGALLRVEDNGYDDMLVSSSLAKVEKEGAESPKEN